MSSPPPRGWCRRQSALLADVRAFNKEALRPTPEIRVTTLLGELKLESHDEVYTKTDDFEEEERQRLMDAAVQKLALLRKMSGKDKSPCQVLPGLFIGPIGAARNLKALRKRGITHILNVSPIVPCYFRDNPEGAFTYHVVPIYDDSSVDLLPHLEKAVEFIAAGRKAGGVLVHCYAGQSRSASFVIAYLLAKESMSLSEAWTTVRRARPSVQPNQGFLRQLAEYEQSVLLNTPTKAICGESNAEEEEVFPLCIEQ